MKICPKGHKNINQTAIFCHVCGEKLENTNCECGYTWKIGDKFCPDCGSKRMVKV